MSDADLSAIAELVQGPDGAEVTVLRGWVEATNDENGLRTRDVETNFGPLPEFATISVVPDDGPELLVQARIIGRQAEVRLVSVRFLDDEGDADEAIDALLLLAPKAYWKKKVVFDFMRESGTSSPKPAARKPAKRRGTQQYVHVTAEHLERVADIYRDAWAKGEPPTQAVAKAMNTSRSTASRWVVLARREKVLGETVGNRPGEAPTFGSTK